MSNQTVRRSPAQPAAQSSRGGRYRRQTGRGRPELRRDGKPLIFGWGGHLSRVQKAQIKRRATWGFYGLIGLLVVGVIGFGVLQQWVLIPNQSIVKVNAVSISQDTYRKELAYQAQNLWNRLQSEIAAQSSTSAAAQSGDPTATSQNQALISQIQADEANYAPASIQQSSVDRLVDDQLIQQGIATYEANRVPPAVFAIAAKDVDAQLAAFKKAFPKGETYANFLDKNSLSDDDVRTSITIELRREKMSAYLSGLVVSPTLQVHLRRIEVDKADTAAKLRAKLVKDPSAANWTAIAKQSSLDANSKDTGGDIGWLLRGNGDQNIEAWAFGTSPKVGAISPVIQDVSGTYNIVQVVEINPSRAVDPSLLSATQGNALDHYLTGARHAKGSHVTNADTNMLVDARNQPVTPDLNAKLPSFNQNNQAPQGA
ncbi:MAG TPA: peptidylprolyl isomerase [Ktedonobacterales bacterium]|nr:peptidylprolyl isomerase [Ktedonobacterales bacterium]